MYKNLKLSLKNKLRQFLHSQDAVSTTEYAILLALIVIGSLAFIRMIGDDVNACYGALNEGLLEVEDHGQLASY
ncbi:MAG: Flp family type IVb pilin [Planctomycetota bacterium]|jgi:Flp pilus assembly pilin Flp